MKGCLPTPPWRICNCIMPPAERVVFDMTKLTGKVAIVTGGAAGIGRACAIAYARQGASVVIADIDDVMAKETLALIGEGSGKAAFLATDVADSGECRRLVSETVRMFGKID